MVFVRLCIGIAGEILGQSLNYSGDRYRSVDGWKTPDSVVGTAHPTVNAGDILSSNYLTKICST